MAFAVPSLLVYLGAARDEILYPYGPAALTNLIFDIGLKLFFSVVLWTAPMALVKIRPRTYLLATMPIVLVLFLFNMLHALEYRDLVSMGAIDAFMNTSGSETYEFVHERGKSVLISLMLGAAAVSVAALVFRRVDPRHLSMRTRAYLAVTLVATCVLALHLSPRVFPVTTIKNAVEYFRYLDRMEELRGARTYFTFDAAPEKRAEENETYVLLIGESLRRTQMPHYGYPRNTTPKLSRIDDLIFLEDVVSPSGQTQVALKASLTPLAFGEQPAHHVRSVLSVANEIGFETTWISNQDRVTDSEIVLIAEEAGSVVFTNHDWAAPERFDEAVLEHLDETLAGPARKKLIVVHLMGSHGQYSRRYPAEYARFKSEGCESLPQGCLRKLTQREISEIDAYDNSVLFTDHVVAEVLERIRTVRGISGFFFFSDHGENLFDTHLKLQGHGFPELTRYEVEIPAFLWLSERFEDRYPSKTEGLLRNRYLPVSSQDFFHSISHLLSATFPLLDHERSIFSRTYQPQPRLIRTVDHTFVKYDCLRLPSRQCPEVGALTLASGL